jgi:hypothetical protein
MIVQFDDVQWGKVLAEAWIDPDFKMRLEANPSEVLREFALREFGLEIDCNLDALTIPDPPAGMFGEQLSGSAGAAGTATATATAGGNASATACGTATAGGHASATACGTATAGGNASATACGTATAGGHASATACGTATAGGN